MKNTFKLGVIAMVCLTISGCAGPGNGPARQILDTTNTSEKAAIDANVQSLKLAMSGYAAANGGEMPTGFTNFVGTGTGCTNGAGESVQCQVTPPSASNNTGHSCSVSMQQLNCSGVFRYFDPVVYSFNSGNITVNAVLKPNR